MNKLEKDASHMREYIAKKLDSIQNLKEKETLRAVLEGVFLPLYDEVNGKYAALEQRVWNEVGVSSQQYEVYSTILPKDKAGEYASWLYPVVDMDMEVKYRSINSHEIILDTIFIEADYLICKEIMQSGETYKGFIILGENKYPIEAKLRPSGLYKNKIGEMYWHFINNGVPWVTLNVPYFFKFFDVVIPITQEFSRDFILKKGAVQWEIPFGKYGNYIKKNLVPVWNIHTFQAESEDFPVLALDKKSYEYSVNVKKYGAENGFLADYHSAPIVHTRKETDAYIITVSEKRDFIWNMVRFVNPSYMDTISFPYPIISNAQESQFASRMVSYYGCKVHTKAELSRLIHSFNMGGYIKFEDLRVLSNRTIKGENYEVNFFMEDELRDGNIGKTLVLQFSKNTNKDIHLIRDIMSFAVSQIQLVFPEYNCVGALL